MRCSFLSGSLYSLSLAGSSSQGSPDVSALPDGLHITACSACNNCCFRQVHVAAQGEARCNTGFACARLHRAASSHTSSLAQLAVCCRQGQQR